MTDVRDIITKLTPRMAEAFELAVRDIRTRAELNRIVRALSQGRITEALQALHISAEAFEQMEEVFRQAYIAGGRGALTGLPALADPFLRAGWWSGSPPAILGRNGSCESTPAV